MNARSPLPRRSTNETLQPESLDTQEELLRAWASREGHDVTRVYRDSSSGRNTKKRVSFQELMVDVQRKPRFEAVLGGTSREGRFDNVDESADWEFSCL